MRYVARIKIIITLAMSNVIYITKVTQAPNLFIWLRRFFLLITEFIYIQLFYPCKAIVMVALTLCNKAFDNRTGNSCIYF